MDNVPPQSSRSTKDLRPVRDSCFTDTVLSGDVVVVVVAAVGGGGGDVVVNAVESVAVPTAAAVESCGGDASSEPSSTALVTILSLVSFFFWSGASFIGVPVIFVCAVVSIVPLSLSVVAEQDLVVDVLVVWGAVVTLLAPLVAPLLVRKMNPQSHCCLCLRLLVFVVFRLCRFLRRRRHHHCRRRRRRIPFIGGYRGV